jgi:cellulose synthase/poly-beta-1,6-N-acetylglucosamine synthase-like glycosyltransferase
MLTWAIIGIYVLLLAFIFAYSLVQLNLLLKYLSSRKRRQNLDAEIMLADQSLWPMVTVQLPVYNELYVVERLIDSAVALNYPIEKLEIQVLDDSTDESFELAANKVQHYQLLGFNIKHIKRSERTGYKAGALAYGLEIAEGEFCAIFDADFVPDPDFLIKTLPHFANKEVGMVQSRWEHLNREYSILTRLQAFALDAHFTVEQGGRNAGNHFINFNGTAGIWRVKAINDSGGWSADTLTEDLDLSYRAQLKGWKFIFLESLGSPAELPAAMNALKTQQYRWNKGAAECARKNLGKVLSSQTVTGASKVHAFFHLMNSGIFVAILGCAMLSIPVLYLKNTQSGFTYLFAFGAFLLLSLFILGLYYFASMKKRGNLLQNLGRFIGWFPFFLSVSMGMSLHNALAVIEGYVGRKTPFVRTPKQGLVSGSDVWKGKKYLGSVINPMTMLEGLLALYFAAGIWLQWHYRDFGLLPLHLMLMVGFALVFYWSVKHSLVGMRKG